MKRADAAHVVAGSYAPQAMITRAVWNPVHLEAHEHASLKSAVSPSKVVPIFRLENWKFLGESATMIGAVTRTATRDRLMPCLRFERRRKRPNIYGADYVYK